MITSSKDRLEYEQGVRRITVFQKNKNKKNQKATNEKQKRVETQPTFFLAVFLNLLLRVFFSGAVTGGQDRMVC